MERKIFWISFTVLGLAADFLLPLWWALARNPANCLRELVDRVPE